MYSFSTNTSYANNLTGAFQPPAATLEPLHAHIERERNSERQFKLRFWLVELCHDDVSVCAGSFNERLIVYATRDFIATLDRTDRNNPLLRDALTALADQNTRLLPDPSGRHEAGFYFRHDNTEYRAHLQYEKKDANDHVTQGKITCLTIYKGNNVCFSSADPYGFGSETRSSSVTSRHASAFQVTALVTRQSTQYTQTTHAMAVADGAPAGGALLPAHQSNVATLLTMPGLNNKKIYEALFAPTLPSLIERHGSAAWASRVSDDTRRKYESFVAFLASQDPPQTVADCLKDFKTFSTAKKAYREIDISVRTTSFMEALRDKCFVLPSKPIAERIQNEKNPKADVRQVAGALDELLALNDTSIDTLIATNNAQRFNALRTELTRGMNAKSALCLLLRHIGDLYFSGQGQ